MTTRSGRAIGRAARAVTASIAAMAVIVNACDPISAQEPSSLAQQPTSTRTSTDQSYYFRYWPHGRAALFKLKDDLVLAIPPQYQKFWLQKELVVREPAQASQIPKVEAVAFDFFLPEFSGYTPQNYLNNFNEDKVEVVELEAVDPAQTEPDAPGYYPPNMLKRALNAYLRSDDYRD